MQKHWSRFWRTIVVLLLIAAASITCFFGYGWWVNWRQRSLHASCTRAQRTHKWAELEQLAEDWCTWQPQSADAWLFRADAAQQLGRFSAAAEFLTAIPESDPKGLAALDALSKLQFGPLDRPLDGVQTCERILKLEPRVGGAHEQLIEFYAMTMQRQKLIQQIRYAIEMSREPPSAYVYLFLADSMRLAQGIELNSRWLRTYPDEEVFQVAEVLQLPEPSSGTGPVDEDKYQRVARFFQKFPNNIELLAYQVDIAIRKGSTPEVTQLLKKVSAREESDDRFWRAKGWVHLNRNELPKARQALQRAIELRPLDWNTRSWLSDLERREGHLEEADRQQLLVRQARRLRESIIALQSLDKVPANILEELLRYAQACGEKQMAETLGRRIQKGDQTTSER